MSSSRQIISEILSIRSYYSILNVFLIPVLILSVMCVAKKDNNGPAKQSVQAVPESDSVKLRDDTSVKDITTDDNETEIEHEEQKHIMMDTTPDNPKIIDKVLLMKMIHHYFEFDPSCMFIANSDHARITINDVQYNQLVTGPTQLLTGYHFGCISSPLGFNRAFIWEMGKDDEIEHFEYIDDNYPISTLLKEFSGVKPFSTAKEFCYIRPEFIQWATQNLVPEPYSKVFGITCKQIYNTLFSSFFRLLYQSLIWLESVDKRYENEYHSYQESIKRGSQGPTYLNETYQNLQFKYVATNAFFREPEAIGFWLRRYWDGSYLSVKQALFEILQKYDKSILNDSYLKASIAKASMNEENEEESQEWGHISTIIWANLSTENIVVEFHKFNYCYEYNSAQWDSLDTVWFDMSVLEECGTSSFDTILVYKNEKISDVKITCYGSKIVQFFDEERYWSPENLPKSYSNEVEFSPIDSTGLIFLKKDIFSVSDVKWDNNLSKQDSLTIDKVLSEERYDSYRLAPSTETIKITWRNAETGEVNSKYVVFQY